MVSARRTRWIRLSILALGLGMGGGLPALVPDARAEDEPPEARPAPEAEAVPEAVPVPEAEVEEGPSRPALDFPDAGLIERDDGTILYFYYTNFVTPADLKSSLEGLLQVPGVQFKEFGQQNALLLEGEPEAVEIAIEAAAYFDVPAPQVFIEARVVEITYSSNFEFGLDYLMSRDPIGPNTLFRGAEGTLNPSSFIQSTLPGGLPFQGSSLLFGFVGEKAQKFGLLDVTLQALQIEGKAEVLSKPSIICTQGIPAEVNTKETRQIFSFQNADRNNTRYQGSLLDSGVTLKVNATHVGESFVTLEIEPEVRGLDRTVLLTPQTLQPAQTTRRAKTTVTMGDGETLVIGGLYTNTILTDRAKTPLLSDIPLLGALFTRSQSTKAKTELLFILTPTIVRKTADLRIITPPAELERLEEAARGESTGQDAGCGVPLCPAPAPVAPAVAPAPPTTPYAAPPPPPPPPAAAPVPANTPPAPVRARPPRDPNAPLPPPRVVSPPTR